MAEAVKFFKKAPPGEKDEVPYVEIPNPADRSVVVSRRATDEDLDRFHVEYDAWKKESGYKEPAKGGGEKPAPVKGNIAIPEGVYPPEDKIGKPPGTGQGTTEAPAHPADESKHASNVPADGSGRGLKVADPSTETPNTHDTKSKRASEEDTQPHGRKHHK